MNLKVNQVISTAVAMACVLGVSSSVWSATYDWAFTNSTTFNGDKSWDQAASWVKQGGGTGYPNAIGDVANITAALGANRAVNPPSNGTVTVGTLNLDITHSWQVFRLMRYTTPGGFRFNNNGNGATLAVTKGTNINFGTNLSALITVYLDDDLLITNGGSNNTAISFGASDSKITGSNDLKIQAGGAGTLTVSLGGTLNNFTGTVRIADAASKLKISNDGGLGNAANAIVLINGGKLDVASISGGYTTTRTISGTGEIVGDISLAGTLGIALIDQTTSDQIDVTGALNLGGNLNLSGYTPTAAGSWTILSATEGITGSFANPLPAGYTTNIVGNDLVLSYIPEPASLAIVAAAGLCFLPRRRRA